VDKAYTTVVAKLKLTGGFAEGTISVTGTLNPETDVYEIPAKAVTDALFLAFATQFGPEATNPPCVLKGAAALTFKSETATLDGAHKTKALTVTWVKGPKCCP